MEESDFITADVFLKAFPSEYRKIDALVFDQPFKWNGGVSYPPPKNTHFLVTGHSDYSITNSLVEKYSPRSWWGLNKETNDPSVHSIPLGIVHVDDRPFTAIMGDLKPFMAVQKEPRQIRNLVYLNFNVHTYPQERRGIYEHFCKLPWVTVGNFNITESGRISFLRDLRNHSFVICPRGNGIDTHRLWETLYMGSIPVVLRHVAMEDFYDLPICFIDRWEDVTPEFLEQEAERISTGSFNMEKLKAGYWINKMKRFSDTGRSL